MESSIPELPKCLIEAFPPQPFDLLVLLRHHITDEMLEEIASADNGMSYQEHLSALRHARDWLGFSVPMSWEPHEVLSLFRWHETGPTTHRSNVLKRAFCCICLLLDDVHQDSRVHMIGSAIDPLTRLLENVLALGSEYPESLARFITWRLPHFDPDFSRDRPFFAVSLLILSLVARKISESEIPKLIDWVIEEVRLEQTLVAGIDQGTPKLLDMQWCSQSDYLWRRHSELLIGETSWIQSPSIRNRVLEIARRLTEQTPLT